VGTEAQWVQRMRSQAEISYMLENYPYTNTLGTAFKRGATAALRWALGRQSSPVTGRPAAGPAKWSEVNKEAQAAAEAMYNGGRTPAGTLSGPYLQGVEHMTTWINGADSLGRPEGWPFPAEAPPVR
jgi:hypothetical protein